MENTSDLKILIVSFYFPPYKKVGGRRWAKHAKYLTKLNIPTFIVAGNFNDTSSWDKDVREFQNSITRIQHTPRKCPFYQKTLPTSFTEKIYWKLSYYLWNCRKQFIKENYNDESVRNEQAYLEAATKVIQQNNINTVILSVGPFSYSQILITLKQKFPTIKFVLDYRDYWEDSFSGLTSAQIDRQKQLQQKVINVVNLVLVPNKEMQKHYSTIFKKETYCLPHCYDIDDINTLSINNSQSVTQNLSNGSIFNLKLIYGGAFYADLEKYISLVVKLINELNKNIETNASFYVSLKGFEKELTHTHIKRFDFIDTNEYFQLVTESDYALLILPENRKNAMSSKFFELVALRKPILYFGETGDVSQFLIKHQLGFHITEQNIIEQVQTIIDNKLTQQIPNLDYDVTTHTFEYQTKLLVQQLQAGR